MIIDIVFDAVNHFWLGIQHGQLPDLGGWNYMLMALFIMLQGRASALLGGIAAAAGYLNIGLIILVALMARVVVDLFWYRIGATQYADRIGSHFGAYESHVKKVHDGLQKRPQRLVLLAKTTGGFSIPVIVAIGHAKIPFRRWLPASFIGELFWTLPLLLLGFFATDLVDDFKGGLAYLTLGSTALFVLFYLLKYIRSKVASRGAAYPSDSQIEESRNYPATSEE